MRTAISKNESIKGAAQGEINAAHGLRDLFEVGLKDIYWAEKVLTKTLPKMMKNASSPELITSLKNQLNQTQEHVTRLEKIFEVTGVTATAKKCEAMGGILKETNSLIKQTDLGVVRDAGIIAADQKVKHYEIATYGTLHAYAKTLGENKAANLLAMSLDEEKKTDAALSEIAMSQINRQAHKATAITNT
ncbi:ferritin-like domain-containing protein [Flavobacterium sandaracinum]|uniref:Ferritin-like domain-containing protein n=1 Tax=Flavobacterium sandaracinum TaxID=2541733 RepID=A0A4R5DBW1_9FLAO|nr:ferritin-like domain-containing protein [Flavobacterium sandaracinum]TDE07743.1 ferritin-like domain-containing protein [Flavobacterium sandaracinum]